MTRRRGRRQLQVRGPNSLVGKRPPQEASAPETGHWLPCAKPEEAEVSSVPRRPQQTPQFHASEPRIY